jgi:hypothetical protein
MVPARIFFDNLKAKLFGGLGFSGEKKKTVG